MNEYYIKAHNPELWKSVKEKFGTKFPFMEALYLFQHELEEPPVCTLCGKPVKFRNINLGYQHYCSSKCSNSDPNKIKQTKETCLERYGGVAPACSKEVSQKMISTAKEHGYDFRGRTGPLSEETKQKMKETCMERYGVENVMKLDEYKTKVSISINYDEIGEKIKNTWKEKEKAKHSEIIDIDYDEYLYTIQCPHPECTRCIEKQFIIPIPRYRDRLRDHTEICTKLLPVGEANIKNTFPEIFVQNILDDHKINYEANNRTILDGKELDLYLPEHNLAIECNGVYWHSDRASFPQNKMRHYEKWRDCQKQDIQLLTIWEDQIYNKPEIVKNIILSKLGIYNYKIGARQCTFIQDHNDVKKFLDKYHLQGSCKFEKSYSLLYNDELVCTMCFSKKNHRVGMGSNNGEISYELVRFCTKSGYQVVGGAQRLLTHFCKEHPGCTIISFASHDISNGNLYEKLRFELISIVPTSYWYIEEKTLKRYHRFSFTKGSLVKKGFDPNLTEFEIMDSLPYYRIYDSGQSKYELKIK